MFGMGFTEILIIAVIAILFLGPDKLPTAMVDIAKFFRSVKNTVGSVKSSLEEEMHVSDIKEEALAYKKELMGATEKVSNATDMSNVQSTVANYADDFLEEVDEIIEKDTKKEIPKTAPKEETVTFAKKDKKIENKEDTNV